ncbi:hypothetical protein [Lichenihabitans psoromatis]|uniref:hypothetical protein n=1 Tax=Lichenihabitans psoromatis TaxID=2528642 RepID=UPI00103662E7|nr:hypothetical protein [Lichenihabitans psoromatis]
MAKGGSAKLKDQNRRQLWLVIAINAVVVYAVSQWAAIQASGLTALAEGAVKLLPVGLAVC